MLAPHALVAYCDRILETSRFTDYAPNGLQVEGEREIRHLVTGVTACAALLEAAQAAHADALLVHHGWFWKGETPCLVGMKARRARLLLTSGMSLIAYHLPLDAHPELGNNAQLGLRLGVANPEPTSIANGLVWLGELPDGPSSAAVAARIAESLGQAPRCVGPQLPRVRRIGWCTGGGQGYLEQAAGLGVELFVSGELAEQTTHQARELGICYLAAGHHATERYGVQALGQHLADSFGLRHSYIEIANPA